MKKNDPYRVLDSDSRGLALEILAESNFAALSYLRDAGAPSVSRIALATDRDGAPITLISDLSMHTAALLASPNCALLIGAPADKGDPLTHPRLTLHCRALPIDRTGAEHTELRTRYVALRPKAKLYIDFADFRFFRFHILDGFLNGGFGKAYQFTAQELIHKEDVL